MSDTATIPGALSADATVTVLLCLGMEGRKATTGPRPLSIPEYNALARWLLEAGLKPGNLLDEEGARALPDSVPDGPTRQRVEALLGRGLSLSILLEKWAARGIHAVTRSDPAYPKKLVRQLKAQRPPVLFVAGDVDLASRRAVAVVGSRDADEAALDLTRRIGQWTAEKGLAMISGGARGVDSAAVLSALEAEGSAVAVLADSLSRAVLDGRYREAIGEGRLLLACPYSPEIGFLVGNAMGRNKLVYALSDAAVVVSSAEGSGGTWAGATEALRNAWVPVFVDGRGSAPSGNRALLAKGARTFAFEELDRAVNLYETAAPIPGPGPQTGTGVAEPVEVGPVFDRVWPLLRSTLAESSAAADVARIIGVRPEQALDWLKLAEARSLARKLGRKWTVTTESSEATERPPVPVSAGKVMALDEIRPVLLRARELGLSLKEMAEILGVRAGQLRDWLAQLDGHETPPKPRKRTRNPPGQPGLFD